MSDLVVNVRLGVMSARDLTLRLLFLKINWPPTQWNDLARSHRRVRILRTVQVGPAATFIGVGFDPPV